MKDIEQNLLQKLSKDRMQVTATSFEGLYLIDSRTFADSRGFFTKQYSKTIFRDNGLDISFLESFYSVSKKGVIRGMHFQIPPKEHIKLVYVSHGSILDVVVDLRKKSKTYGKYYFVTLSSNGKSLYIPVGFAHGFLSLEDDTCVHYSQTSEYDRECDKGIYYDSFGFPWTRIASQYGIDRFILSDRDLSFDNVVGDYF